MRASSTVEHLTLAVGEQKTRSARGIRSYSSSGPGIVDLDATPDGSDVVVVGRSSVVGGTADVVVTVVVVVEGVSDATRQASIETLRHTRRMERLHARFPARRNS